MSNPVLILSYNNLEALKKCVESVRAQDVPDLYLRILDNASTDGTIEWLNGLWDSGYKDKWSWFSFGRNIGVSCGWNHGLNEFFNRSATQDGFPADHCLVLNQDTILPPYFYRELLSANAPFVTGCPVGEQQDLDAFDVKPEHLHSSPCFSAFLIRRDCWEVVEPFDETMFSWASDCDYHVRAHLLGIKLQMSEVPFAHRAGTTIRTASPEMRKWFGERANKDRAVFREKYGCEPGTPEYGALFAPGLFGIKKS